MQNSPPHDDLAHLLRRCSQSTIESAIRFRETSDLDLLPVIVRGIIARFLEPATKNRVANSNADFHLVDDLGIDSLLRIEIVMIFEEVFDVTVSNDDLVHLETITDVSNLIAQHFESRAEANDDLFEAAAPAASLRPPA